MQILRENNTPINDLETLHEVVRKAYFDIESYANSEITANLGKRLFSLLCREVLPETKMLLAKGIIYNGKHLKLSPN